MVEDCRNGIELEEVIKLFHWGFFMFWEDLTEEQRGKYNDAINTLIQLASTGEQMMTIHQLRYEFGERFYLDCGGNKVSFLEFVSSMYCSNQPIWFMKYLEHLKEEKQLVELIEEKRLVE